jgi:hypothetical protein
MDKLLEIDNDYTVERNRIRSNDITGYLYYVIESHVVPDLT